MTFIVPERSFSDYAANFHPGEIDLLLLTQQEPQPEAAKAVLFVEDPGAAFFGLIEGFFDHSASEEITGIT